MSKRKIYSCWDGLVVASSRRQAKALLEEYGYRHDKMDVVSGSILMVTDTSTFETEMVPVEIVASWYPGPSAQIIPEI